MAITLYDFKDICLVEGNNESILHVTVGTDGIENGAVTTGKLAPMAALEMADSTRLVHTVIAGDNGVSALYDIENGVQLRSGGYNTSINPGEPNDNPSWFSSAQMLRAEPGDYITCIVNSGPMGGRFTVVFYDASGVFVSSSYGDLPSVRMPYTTVMPSGASLFHFCYRNKDQSEIDYSDYDVSVYLNYNSVSDNDRLSVVESYVSDIKGVVYGEESVFSSFSEQNANVANMSVAPFVVSLRGASANAMRAKFTYPGTLSIGYTTDRVAGGAPFDISSYTVDRVLTVEHAGIQTVALDPPLVIPSDALMFFGMPGDTARFVYGQYGTTANFWYPSDGEVYTKSPNRLGFDLLNIAPKIDSVYSGKTLSILGDSISTYSGYIPSGNVTYYPSDDIDDVSYTWWKKLIDALGMTLDVNNSWSGSRVTTTAGDDAAGCMARCQNLGTSPDVIVVYMGINDFNNEVSLGAYDGKSSVPSSTTEFREAYAVMLSKILTAYKTSEVWACTLPQCERNGTSGFPEINGNGVALLDFNMAIEDIARAFGVKVLDLNRCGLTYQNMDVYNPNELHPNRMGHSLMANCAIKALDNAVRVRY